MRQFLRVSRRVSSLYGINLAFRAASLASWQAAGSVSDTPYPKTLRRL
jgi:hypothetical protein